MADWYRRCSRPPALGWRRTAIGNTTLNAIMNANDEFGEVRDCTDILRRSTTQDVDLSIIFGLNLDRQTRAHHCEERNVHALTSPLGTLIAAHAAAPTVSVGR